MRVSPCHFLNQYYRLLPLPMHTNIFKSVIFISSLNIRFHYNGIHQRYCSRLHTQCWFLSPLYCMQVRRLAVCRFWPLSQSVYFSQAVSMLSETTSKYFAKKPYMHTAMFTHSIYSSYGCIWITMQPYKYVMNDIEHGFSQVYMVSVYKHYCTTHTILITVEWCEKDNNCWMMNNKQSSFVSNVIW